MRGVLTMLRLRSTFLTVFLFAPSIGPVLSVVDSPVTFPGDALSPGAEIIGMSVEPRTDLISPLRLQRERERSMNTFQMVPGALQAGAVGYMAYRVT
jgi:hypothetical protein